MHPEFFAWTAACMVRVCFCVIYVHVCAYFWCTYIWYTLVHLYSQVRCSSHTCMTHTQDGSCYACLGMLCMYACALHHVLHYVQTAYTMQDKASLRTLMNEYIMSYIMHETKDAEAVSMTFWLAFVACTEIYSCTYMYKAMSRPYKTALTLQALETRATSSNIQATCFSYRSTSSTTSSDTRARKLVLAKGHSGIQCILTQIQRILNYITVKLITRSNSSHAQT